MGRPQRILAYDALRVFAIMTVVGIHTFMPYRIFVPDHAPVRVFDDLLHYAVPLFVFISGAFAWGRPLPSDKGSFRSFLSRRGRVILIPFAFWSALYLVLLVAREGALRLPYTFGVLLVGNTWYHLYFVPMLLTFYLLTPLASWLFVRSPVLLVAVCYGIRILLGATIVSAASQLAGTLGSSYATHVVTHLPHMALGAWFAARYDSVPLLVRRSWPALIALGTAVLTAASLGLHLQAPEPVQRLVYPLGMAATVLGLAFGGRELEGWLESSEVASRVVLSSAPLAFGVYFVHPLFLLGFFEAVPARAGSLWSEPWFPVVVWATATAGSFAVSAVFSRIPGLARVIGIVRPLGG